MTAADVENLIDARFNGDVYMTGVAPAGLTFVLTIAAKDNPLDSSQYFRSVHTL